MIRGWLITGWRPILGVLVLTAFAGAAEKTSAVTTIGGEILHANTLEFGPLSIRDVVAMPSLEQRVLRFEPCSGHAYGGQVSGRVALALDTGAYRLRLELAKADLAIFLRQFHGNGANLGGAVDGWVELDIPGDRPDAMVGRGELHITNGTLVHFPLLANLLIGDPTASRNQDALDAVFTIAGGKLNLGETILRSPAATISFSGTIGLDGELAIELIPELRLKVMDAATVGLISRILAPIGRRAARALLRGQMTNPILVMNPFGLSE